MAESAIDTKELSLMRKTSLKKSGKIGQRAALPLPGSAEAPPAAAFKASANKKRGAALPPPKSAPRPLARQAAAWRAAALVFGAGSIAAGAAGCASMKKMAIKSFLERARDKTAPSVKYEEPPPSYRRQEHPQLDALWWSRQAGASISYLSSCSADSQSLKEIKKTVLSEIKGYRQKREETAKDSLYSVVEMNEPGQKTMTALFILKKGGCSYILNFVAPSKAVFKAEEPVFRRFIDGFKPS